ncbi:MAG TPA: hypothetical protein VFJ43_06610, partial [Bacteroidia bacterium]|nr:hypothetical protein [Bacteroidia bacterium]
MKPRFRVALFAIPVFVGLALYTFVGSRCAAAPKPADTNPKKEAVVLDIMLRILKNAHFRPLEINDDFSHKVYDTYLKRA